MSQTADRILDVAQRRIQQHGFNAVSYGDLSEEVGIRTASIHYHFRSKRDLGLAAMRRYHDAREAKLAAIDTRYATHQERLLALVDVYRALEDEGLLCLAGAFAADLHALPWALQVVVRAHLDLTERWIERVVREGRETGEFLVTTDPGDFAVQAVANLQGALLVARARKGEMTLSRVGRALLAQLGVRAGTMPGRPGLGTDLPTDR